MFLIFIIKIIHLIRRCLLNVDFVGFKVFLAECESEVLFQKFLLSALNLLVHPSSLDLVPFYLFNFFFCGR